MSIKVRVLTDSFLQVYLPILLYAYFTLPPSLAPVSTGIGPQSLPELGYSGQDLGFGGFAFAPKLPELLNTNLPTVSLGQS